MWSKAVILLFLDLDNFNKKEKKDLPKRSELVYPRKAELWGRDNMMLPLNAL